MKKVYLALLTLLFILILPTPVNAALDCEIGPLTAVTDGDDNVQALDVKVCIGGFPSADLAVQPITINVDCLDKSGQAHLIGDNCWHSGQSRTITPIRENIGTEDRDGNGTIDNYYTCFDIQNINRDVGKITVDFTSPSGSCTTEPKETLPANYDYWYENVRQIFEDNDGDNSGENIVSPICADGRINTAIGCIDYDIVGFTRYVLGWSLGVGGGVALVLIAYSGILFMLSSGDPNKLNEAKSIFIAALSGLMLIIFSTFLLRVIGVDILNLF